MVPPELPPRDGRARLLRIVGAGALSGAVLLSGMLLALSLATTAPSGWLDPGIFIGSLHFGTIIGGVTGAIVGPLLRYTLLRYVPASSAIAWSMLGATGGLAAGILFGWYWRDRAGGVAGLGGAVLGLCLSSIVLWRRYRPPHPNAAV